MAACGGSGPAPAAPRLGPAVDERAAEKDAKGLVGEIYQAIGRGKPDSLFALVGDPVFVFGPRRGDAMVSRSDALGALGSAVDAKHYRGKQHPQLRSSGLDVVVSQGGHSAWAVDAVQLDGRTLAVTAVLSNIDDLWSVTAAAVAETPTTRQAKAEAARDAIVPPGALAAAWIDPRAGPAVDKLKQGLLDQRSWGDELASRSDAVVIGPTVGEVARGKAAIKRLWGARMKAHVREAISGELAASITADGQLVWISVPVTRVADGEAVMPLRIFAVYEKAGASWKMIALHEAVAVDKPSSGAPYRKILPPAPPAPEPAKTEVADRKPSDAAKPKRNKKRPRPTDD